MRLAERALQEENEAVAVVAQTLGASCAPDRHAAAVTPVPIAHRSAPAASWRAVRCWFAKRALSDARLAPALQRLHGDPARNWHLDELARACAMDEQQLCQLGRCQLRSRLDMLAFLHQLIQHPAE
jgi:hypothetical protein